MADHLTALSSSATSSAMASAASSVAQSGGAAQQGAAVAILVAAAGAGGAAVVHPNLQVTKPIYAEVRRKLQDKHDFWKRGRKPQSTALNAFLCLLS